MSNIIIYTAPFCPYCSHAKYLLSRKKINFIEIDVGKDPGKRREMVQKSRQRTVPQIFNGNTHIGDCSEIYVFESKGELDALLA